MKHFGLPPPSNIIRKMIVNTLTKYVINLNKYYEKVISSYFFCISDSFTIKFLQEK